MRLFIFKQCLFLGFATFLATSFIQAQAKYDSKEGTPSSSIRTSPYLTKGSFIFAINGGTQIKDVNIYSSQFTINKYGFDINTSAGYLFSRHLSASLLLGLNFSGISGSSTDSLGVRKSDSYSALAGLIGAEVTTYFLKNAFFKLGYIYEGNAQVKVEKATVGGESLLNTSSSIFASLGYMFFVSDRVSLNPAFNYKRYLDPILGEGYQVQNFTVSLGVSYLLPSKKK